MLPKGYKHSQATRDKISAKLKGKMPKNLAMLNANKKGSGNPMWGKHTSELQKETARARKGKLHHNWKGDNVGYCGLHDWLRSIGGSANKCENKDCKKEGKPVYHWANITGIYKRERKHWAMLCVTCHNRFDKKLIKLLIKNKKYVKRH